VRQAQTAASGASRPVTSRLGQRRRVAWSSDFLQPRLSTVDDETFFLDDASTDVVNGSRNSHAGQLRLGNKNEFGPSDDDFEMDDGSNPVTPSADRQEGQDDEVVSETARGRRVLFFTGFDEDMDDAIPASGQSDVEMRDDSPCFSDPDGIDNRH